MYSKVIRLYLCNIHILFQILFHCSLLQDTESASGASSTQIRWAQSGTRSPFLKVLLPWFSFKNFLGSLDSKVLPRMGGDENECSLNASQVMGIAALQPCCRGKKNCPWFKTTNNSTKAKRFGIIHSMSHASKKKQNWGEKPGLPVSRAYVLSITWGPDWERVPLAPHCVPHCVC